MKTPFAIKLLMCFAGAFILVCLAGAVIMAVADYLNS